MKRLPEGVRRVCLILGVVLAACWLLWIAIETKGFVYINSTGWAVLPVVTIVVYLIPSTLYRVYAWVKDGFAIDKTTK